MGPAVYRFLIKHIEDDRYSYSKMVGADGHWVNCSVGDAVRRVLSDGCNGGLYKVRKGKGGEHLSPPRFWEYVESQGGVERWAQAVMNRTRTDIDNGFFEWCIKTEEARGFEDFEEYERILAQYRRKIVRPKKAQK